MPEVLDVHIANELDALHVVNHNPEVSWSFFDPVAALQDSFEIAVGDDDDWQYAEMWNPEPFGSSDTNVVYAGAALVDGATYFTRLRVHNSYTWSDWMEMSFRMNSLPSIPSLYSPVANEVVSTTLPDLVISNSSDAEDDSLIYTFQVSSDSFATILIEEATTEDVGETTVLTLASPLDENSRYWWRVKASDYYEESEFSEATSFYVNSENTAPGEFDLILPPDTSGEPVIVLDPTFSWVESTDPDPLDSVLYTLNVAIDSNFEFVNQIPDIPGPYYTYTDSMDWDTRYWWKVKAEDQNGGVTWSSSVLSFRTVTLGDANSSGVVDIDDVVWLINYVFRGGPEPYPLFAGDDNCDGSIDIDDIVYLITYVFQGGPEPCAPELTVQGTYNQEWQNH